MKKKFTVTALLLLSLSLLLCSVSCSDQANGNDRVILSTADSGILSDGLIAESSLPQNTEIQDWYEESKSREILPYALLYSKDESDGRWHCWLYVGTWQDGDSLKLGKLDASGFCVTIDYATPSENPQPGCTGAFHFSFSYDEGEPTFEFSVNGDTDGLISTVSDVSVAP